MNKNLKNIIEKGIEDWIEPKNTYDDEGEFVSKLQSNVQYNCNDIPINLSINLPTKVYDFYNVIKTGYFFKDIEYGQWGLKIFSLQECREKSNYWRKNRTDDFDLKRWVIGEFFGDSDLLIYDERCSCLLVATPLDTDEEWEIVGVDFSDFFSKYFEYPLSKFWEL